VRITPRRAGTFIYHTHSMEVHQMGAGLFGPLLVLNPGQVRDTARERIIVLGRHGPVIGAPPSFNGETVPGPLELRVGTTYRFRVISISPNENKELSLFADTLPLRWRPVGKDGATLPAHQAKERVARIAMATGETWDLEFTPRVARELVLDVLTTGVGLPPKRTRVPVLVRAR
jgi:FtsP/CotA-like multicopper oxidase with cupredoxin domain